LRLANQCATGVEILSPLHVILNKVKNLRAGSVKSLRTSSVKDLWQNDLTTQVRDVLMWGFETDTIRPTCGLICVIASDMVIAVESTSLVGRQNYAAGLLPKQQREG